MYCYRHPDRETGLSCSECGRPICTECMTVAPVGLRCPEHSGRRQGSTRVVRTMRGAAAGTTGGVVTKTLIAINVAIYLLQLAMGAGTSAGSGWIFEHGALVRNAVYSNGSPAGLAHGEWWRLITAAFLHAGPLHIGLNMLALWWFGQPVEAFLGRARYLLLYLVSGLAGSAGALIATPNAVTVGASGAIFGVLGAALVLERQRINVLGGSALAIVVINLIFSFTISGISIGGHIGGLVGGAAAMLVLSHLGRRHPVYGRTGLGEIAGVIAVGIVSVLVSYWKVRGNL